MDKELKVKLEEALAMSKARGNLPLTEAVTKALENEQRNEIRGKAA